MQRINRYKTAARTVVRDESLLHKVNNTRSDMPMLGIHIHAQTSDFHSRIVAAMLTVRK